MRKNWKKELLEYAKTFVICAMCVYLFTMFVAKTVVVVGSSMYPTLEDGEFGITNVFSAKFLDIERFDIVIVYIEELDEYWVKRVVGLPGETISCKNDVLYIDGDEVKQPFLDKNYVNDEISEHGAFTRDFNEITLGEDEYFLMGDNRNHSSDSRVEDIGPFTRDQIVGKDVLILYPFDKIKIAE